MLKTRWGRWLLWIVRMVLAVYLGLLLLVFCFQRKLIYHPSQVSLDLLTSRAAANQFEQWKDAQGRFIGWKQIDPRKGEHARLLVLHGNAGDALDCFYFGTAFQRFMPMDVYLLEYPGFGAREGSPSQKSLFQAADEAIGLLGKKDPVYLMGQSLGTGVACYLAGTHPDVVAGVLLIAPYNNLSDVGQYTMPWVPVSLLMLDRFPSSTYLKNYAGPVAMLFGGQDVIVPNRFGHKLFDGYEGPKKFWEIPTAGHGDLMDHTDAWWRGLMDFWTTNTVRKSL